MKVQLANAAYGVADYGLLSVALYLPLIRSVARLGCVSDTAASVLAFSELEEVFLP